MTRDEGCELDCELDSCELDSCELNSCELVSCELDGCELVSCELDGCELVSCELDSSLIDSRLTHKGTKTDGLKSQPKRKTIYLEI